MNATVDEDTDGCDMTVTKVTPPPVTPETPKPSEPVKPEQPKPIEPAKAETGDTGYGIAGMDATTVAVAGGIGILALAGGTVYFTKRRKKNAEDAS